MKDSVEVIEQLNKKYKIFIVSAAMEFPESLKDKLDWLNENFPFLVWQQFVFCGSKSIVHGDYMIDDLVRNFAGFNGKKYLNKETVELFTAYHSSISRRGYGFDKPEKDNATRPEPYPCLSASPQTFGHTGFTGTCVWVDPESKIVFVFLSNRVYPTRNNSLLSDMSIRPKILEAIYQAVADKKR